LSQNDERAFVISVDHGAGKEFYAAIRVWIAPHVVYRPLSFPVPRWHRWPMLLTEACMGGASGFRRPIRGGSPRHPRPRGVDRSGSLVISSMDRGCVANRYRLMKATLAAGAYSCPEMRRARERFTNRPRSTAISSTDDFLQISNEHVRDRRLAGARPRLRRRRHRLELVDSAATSLHTLAFGPTRGSTAIKDGQSVSEATVTTIRARQRASW
jgi:hypothetical protein